MRIKLNSEQLNKLTEGLPFQVILERSSDVRGLMEILGKEMPWDDTGLSKLGDSSPRRPTRVAFSVEPTQGGFICDIHPALVQHIYNRLSASTEVDK